MKSHKVIVLLIALCAGFLVTCSDDPNNPSPDHTIVSISPTSGPAGVEVTITGTGFSQTPAENGVTFNFMPANVLSATSTTLVVEAPVSGSTGAVAVTIGGTTVTGPTFTYLEAPAIIDIDPDFGAKGSSVTIMGMGFSTVPTENIVRFGGTQAVVTNASATELVVTVPDVSGTVQVTVERNGLTATGPGFSVTGSVMVTTLAGSTQGYQDGDGASAQFYQLRQLTVDGAGNVYVADQANHKIRKISPAGQVTTVIGTTEGYANGNSAIAKFAYPFGIEIDGSGNLYVSEITNHCIRKINTTPEAIHLAGSAESTAGNADGTGTAAGFHQPSGIASDNNGNLYVADSYNHKIRKITPAGVVTTFAGSTQGYQDGTGTAAQFNHPVALTVDSNGNVYVFEATNLKIRKITPAGAVTTLLENLTGYAFGMAIDQNDNLVIALTAKIYRVSSTGTLTLIAGSNSGYADGPAETAEFNFISGLAIDSQGDIYVSDSGNHRIRKVSFE